MQAHTMVDDVLFDELLSGYDEAAAEAARILDAPLSGDESASD